MYMKHTYIYICLVSENLTKIIGGHNKLLEFRHRFIQTVNCAVFQVYININVLSRVNYFLHK